MGVFGWLKSGKKVSLPTIPNEGKVKLGEIDIASSDREQFQSPETLARWVSRLFLEERPLSDNYRSLPNEESRNSINMTYEQRERYIREIPVLQVAGISLFIKQHHDDLFWLSFSQTIYPVLVKYLNSDSYETTVGEIAQVIENYVNASKEKDELKVSSQYMHRVYDDSDHFVTLTLSGIGFLAVTWLMDSYEIFREAHYQVTQGS